MKKVLAGVCLLFGSFGASAGGLDLALSNETANLSLLLNPAHRFNQASGSELSLGGFISEQGDKLAHASLMARGHQENNGTHYNVGAGMKAIVGDVAIPAIGAEPEGEESVGAVALGFQFGVLLVSSRNNPVELKFEGFLAPSITSWADAERYTELSARLQVEVIPQAQAYIGYRRIRFDTNDYDDVNLDRSVHFGIKLTF